MKQSKEKYTAFIPISFLAAGIVEHLYGNAIYSGVLVLFAIAMSIVVCSDYYIKDDNDGK